MACHMLGCHPVKFANDREPGVSSPLEANIKSSQSERDLSQFSARQLVLLLSLSVGIVVPWKCH